jgi:hypothetical protein
MKPKVPTDMSQSEEHTLTPTDKKNSTQLLRPTGLQILLPIRQTKLSVFHTSIELKHNHQHYNYPIPILFVKGTHPDLLLKNSDATYTQLPRHTAMHLLHACFLQTSLCIDQISSTIHHCSRVTTINMVKTYSIYRFLNRPNHRSYT